MPKCGEACPRQFDILEIFIFVLVMIKVILFILQHKCFLCWSLPQKIKFDHIPGITKLEFLEFSFQFSSRIIVTHTKSLSFFFAFSTFRYIQKNYLVVITIKRMIFIKIVKVLLCNKFYIIFELELLSRNSYYRIRINIQ